MNKWLYSFILFYYVVFSTAQTDVNFINHLTINNLNSEHLTYLNTITQRDSAYYFKTKFACKYQNKTMLLSNFLKSKHLCMTDSALLAEASTFFLNDSNQSLTQSWFNNFDTLPNCGNKNFITIYNASINPNLYSIDVFAPEVKKSFFKFKNSYNKKPIVAAFFSAILPGSGKLYSGKTKTFLLTFILNVAYAAQTIESKKKLGIKHPLTIINFVGFTAFYLSNIYGSYWSSIQIRKERKKQFIKDATYYYN